MNLTKTKKNQLHVELDAELWEAISKTCPEAGMRSILVRRLLKRFFDNLAHEGSIEESMRMSANEVANELQGFLGKDE